MSTTRIYRTKKRREQLGDLPVGAKLVGWRKKGCTSCNTTLVATKPLPGPLQS